MKGKTKTCFLTPIPTCFEDEEKNAGNAETIEDLQRKKFNFQLILN